MVRDDKLGDIFVIENLSGRVPLGLVAAAGKDPRELSDGPIAFEDLWRGGWDPKCRLTDQDKDGVAAEVIYPSVGMMLCNHHDFDYKKACFDAYNRWLQGYCSEDPQRLIGMAQTAMRSVEEGIEDLRHIKEMGFRGVMMPGVPAVEDYDSPIYDPFWKAAVELELPLSFHILTSGSDSIDAKPRGPKINTFMSIMRVCQDIVGMLCFTGVFERHPDLTVVCVEADAGWAPHYMYRMDHAFERHRFWMKASPLERMPSEYFREYIYLTFQDDWVAFKVRNLLNIERLMWANDFPHSDSTWPWSQELLQKHTTDMTEQERNLILHDNAARLYNLAEHGTNTP